MQITSCLPNNEQKYKLHFGRTKRESSEDSVLVIGLESEIGKQSSNSSQFCFINFILIPFVKEQIHLPPVMG